MLTDLAFSAPRAKHFRPELVCVAAILFTVKFEGDFNGRLWGFHAYIKGKLLITQIDLKKAEQFLLNLIPDNFVLIPTASDLMESLIAKAGIEEVFASGLDRIVNNSLETYVAYGHALNVYQLCIQPLLIRTFTLQVQHKLLNGLIKDPFLLAGLFSDSPPWGQETQ